MPPVKRRSLTWAGGLAATACLALPAWVMAQEPPTGATGAEGVQPAAGTQDTESSHRQVSPLGIEIRRLHGGKVNVGKYAYVVANLRPYVQGEKVKLLLLRNGHVIQRVERRVKHVPGHNSGRVKMRTKHLIKPAHYRGVAIHKPTQNIPHAKTGSKSFTVRYRSLNGGTSDAAGIFNDLLNHDGYANAPNGRSYNDATRRAVLAFRKVNGMARITSATSGIFKRLADRRGRFKPKYPGAGRHVEVDISRQVMALIDHGKAQYTYHVSTGAPATPTIRGHFHFYRKTPGYNSEGMYYSVYFIRGYATHGYHSVPTYNASHGCVRNPIPDSQFIYNWIHLGESIYTYG
jgi:lipoprotein-anchoring transpeptidase ErfK/SrfK